MLTQECAWSKYLNGSPEFNLNRVQIEEQKVEYKWMNVLKLVVGTNGCSTRPQWLNTYNKKIEQVKRVHLRYFARMLH